MPPNLTPKEAIELQKQLRSQIRLEPLTKKPTLIGGCDVSMNRFASEGFAGFVTLDESLNMVDHFVVKDTIPFPYVPGLLSFREIPMLLNAWDRLTVKPNVIIVDGVGIAHPRRMGIATHLGLILGVPTIGCAKSVLTGVYEEPGLHAGATSYMYDPKQPDEVIGAAYRSKANVKPVFISPGHLITLDEAIAIVHSCVRKHRLPEPTRFAHNVVNAYRVEDALAH